MEFTHDSLIVGKWDDAPIRIHWTVILCALLFSRFRFVPFYWIAYILLVLIHEAGHALLIRYFGFWIEEIVVHGMGGYCRWVGSAGEVRSAIIAWGGFLAQAILFLFANSAILLFGHPYNPILSQVSHAFIATNLWLMLFNLVPIEPLDGAKAWGIIDPLRYKLNAKIKAARYRKQDKAIQKELKRIMDIDPFEKN